MSNPLLTNMEYLTGNPFAPFTTPQGFDGRFFGDDGLASTGFTVTSDAHTPTHALVEMATTTGFAEIGTTFTSPSGCYDVSAFTGLRFWAKGIGTLSVRLTDVGFPVVVATLGSNYAQYDVPFSSLMFSPAVLSANRNLLFSVSGIPAGPALLFLDDISFTP